MKVLLVLAHPLADSLCAHLAANTEALLRTAGHEVERLDLYAEPFAPALTPDERRAYYGSGDATADLTQHHAQLRAAEALVLVFPTWWFSMPAILKGWFDRVWSPGVAFDHGTPIQPLLRLKSCIAITTLGSPWWFDWLVMWRPVGRVLRRGILLACAPKAKFSLLSLHSAESVTPDGLAAFEARIEQAVKRLDRT